MTDDEELHGEDELFDLWLDTERRTVDLAEKLDLTNEQLKKIVARWENLGREGTEHPLSHLAKHVLVIRDLRQVVAMMRPGEDMAPLSELAARFRHSKGEA